MNPWQVLHMFQDVKNPKYQIQIIPLPSLADFLSSSRANWAESVIPNLFSKCHVVFFPSGSLLL